MTITEMHLAFNLELKAQGNHEDFQPEEIDVFLNRAIRAFVDSKKPVLRVDEIALNDVRTLIRSHRFPSVDLSNHPYFENVVIADLTAPSPDFEFPVGGRVKVTDGGGTWKGARFYHYADFLAQLTGEDNTPVYRMLPLTVEDNDLLVFYDSRNSGVDSVHLSYLTGPAVVSFSTPTNSDLPAHTHPLIVSAAVQTALQAIFRTE